jgi:UDP-N-acetylmuramyl pentapeptide phosphotransferase/UDP-N-acetylglucosamine-1-phosphate transferase
LLAASSLGFLFHNWPPARVFMGDVGSAFLGYTFAVMPLFFDSHLSARVGGLGPVVAGILPLWPFVFDSTFTFLRRLCLGEDVFSAHRSHLYQRLVIVGYTHRFVALLYIGLAALGTFLALGWVLRWRNSTTAVAVILPLLCLSLWIFVTRCEGKAARRLHSRLPTYMDPV